MLTVEQLLRDNQDILIRLATLYEEYHTAEQFWEDSHENQENT